MKNDLGSNENCLEIAGARVVLNNYKSPKIIFLTTISLSKTCSPTRKSATE